MRGIPNNTVVFQQWMNISYEKFLNKIEPPRIEPSEKDTNTLKSFCNNSTYVKFKRQVGVNSYSQIRGERNIAKKNPV